MKLKIIFIGVFSLTLLIGIFFTLPFDLFERETAVSESDSGHNKITVFRENCKFDYDLFSNINNLGKICNYYEIESDVQKTANVAVEPAEPKSEPGFEPEIFGIKEPDDYVEPDYKIKLIDLVETENNYRKEEVIAKSGEIWLGLFKESGKYYLRESKIKIKPEDRPNYGYEDSVTIQFSNKKNPIFLLKNAKKLKTGKVKTLYERPSFEEAEKHGVELKQLGVGFVQKINFNKTIYTFSVKKGRTDKNRNVLVLVLDNGKRSQIVEFSSFFETGDNIGNILWAGDLDRDGKLDFYMDYYNYEKGGIGTGLYLSSEAEKGKLVKQVASFGTAGC
jgi:hypothetical protein